MYHFLSLLAAFRQPYCLLMIWAWWNQVLVRPAAGWTQAEPGNLVALRTYLLSIPMDALREEAGKCRWPRDEVRPADRESLYAPTVALHESGKLGDSQW